MLGYLILVAVQFAVAFYGTPKLVELIRIPIRDGNVAPFISAAAAAVIVWVTGVVGSLILKDVKMPVSATLMAALIGALIGAAIVAIPFIRAHNPIDARQEFFWIAGAIAGYLAKR